MPSRSSPSGLKHEVNLALYPDSRAGKDSLTDHGAGINQNSAQTHIDKIIDRLDNNCAYPVWGNLVAADGACRNEIGLNIGGHRSRPVEHLQRKLITNILSARRADLDSQATHDTSHISQVAELNHQPNTIVGGLSLEVPLLLGVLAIKYLRKQPEHKNPD